ncbi:zinc ribbon domain-containing protein [Pseudidiomarina insulisalsae]|uniref:Zinc ribbon domain-containing protein n=1 Tax=Pseudidiomarina insulisalsae TaxID=575789 RepID=A0A432YQ15_9GAMM|nr:zinc ribbon domain-containing protein [Pseudidiomarina insulisalsae]RUO63117.1 zinc ribbon domain-containing protein [Pseudidiomarina insulisalsae]
MAIEKCPQCEDQVLDNKYSCPACGFVKRDKPEIQRHPERSKITTKTTSKSLQIQGVVSLLLFIAGLVWFYISGDEYAQRNELNVVALVMFVVGFIWYILVRFFIWRSHD